MNNGPKPLINSKIIIIIMLVAIVLIMLATAALNGGNSAPAAEINTEKDVNSNESTQSAIDYKLIGNNSYGTVTKSSGYGNPASDIHVALILGVDSKRKSQNSIVPTLQNEKELNYCYDVYIVDATNADINNDSSNNQSNLTLNEISESLASEYVVPDVANNNYNFTMDVHSTNDSNSYIFVPSDYTYTSKKVAESISNNTGIGRYTPDKHSYTESVSKPIISYDIPSIVYVTRDYYSNNTSSEVSSIIHVIDTFDFVGLFSSDSDTSSDIDSSNETNVDSNLTNNTLSNNSTGNKEVN